MILLFLFNLKLCFETKNLFSAQFGELENVYKFTQETFARSSFECTFNYLLYFHRSIF